MINDALLKFAAEKLGVPLKPWRNQWVYPNTIADRRAWIEIDDEAYNLFDLNSWDLMGKGLAEINKIEPKIFFWIFNRLVSLSRWNGRWIRKEVQQASDIPLAFWTAWYKLEHSSHTKESTNS